MKPIRLYQIMLSLLGVLVVLLTISIFVPENGLSVGELRFKFPTIHQLANPKKQNIVHIDSLFEKIDTVLVDESPPVKHMQESDGNMGEPKQVELTIKQATSFHFHQEGEKKLMRFFEQITQAALAKKKVHILHYGDSQIEGDRMTSFIRERLQTQFGGNGPGLIPATNVYNTLTFTQEYSPNFKRYTCFGGNKLASRKYGIMGSAARFTPEFIDSTQQAQQIDKQSAWIQIAASQKAFSRARKFNSVKMYYTSCVKPCAINVYENETIIHQDSLINDNQAHVFTLSFPNTPQRLRFEFTSEISPTISNFSLEGDYGIQMSNIAMRGSSGTFLSSMDRNTIRVALDQLNPDLIIMQFGGNSVPHFKDSSSVRNFARYFKGQLTTLKSLKPTAAIVVIGPSDMSRLEEGIYETYPLLPYCVKEMQTASMDAGAIFWNLYEAMGGKDSMPAWVNKGLAGSDYIHFSPSGARVAAQLFYDALMNQYIQWKNQ